MNEENLEKILDDLIKQCDKIILSMHEILKNMKN